MKQTVRDNCFETNSSSYHTLTIKNIDSEEVKREIIKGEDLYVDTGIEIKSIGWSHSYCYVARSTYDKAQLLLRFIGSELYNQLHRLVPIDEYKNVDGTWDYNKREKLLKEVFYKTPLIEAYVEAIKKFIGPEFNVYIKFLYDCPPFIDEVYDSNRYLYQVLDVEEVDLTNVQKLTDRFYEIIFNPKVELIDECESNE